MHRNWRINSKRSKTYSTTEHLSKAETCQTRGPDAACSNRNGLNGAKRLNGWNDWNGCSFIHRVLIARFDHEHGHDHEPRTRSFTFFVGSGLYGHRVYG